MSTENGTHVTLRDRVRCQDLIGSTGMRDASNLAERLKWKWSGHVARMDTQAHHVGPQRRQKKRGTTTDEMG